MKKNYLLGLMLIILLLPNLSYSLSPMVIRIDSKIYFRPNSSNFSNPKQSQNILKDVAKIIFYNSENIHSIMIEAHTDAKGSVKFNQRLAYQRGIAVKRILVNLGVLDYLLEVRAFGETRPIADNSTQEGRSLNNRVEFEVVHGEYCDETRSIEDVEKAIAQFGIKSIKSFDAQAFGLNCLIRLYLRDKQWALAQEKFEDLLNLQGKPVQQWTTFWKIDNLYQLLNIYSAQKKYGKIKQTLDFARKVIHPNSEIWASFIHHAIQKFEQGGKLDTANQYYIELIQFLKLSYAQGTGWFESEYINGCSPFYNFAYHEEAKKIIAISDAVQYLVKNEQIALAKQWADFQRKLVRIKRKSDMRKDCPVDPFEEAMPIFMKAQIELGLGKQRIAKRSLKRASKILNKKTRVSKFYVDALKEKIAKQL